MFLRTLRQTEVKLPISVPVVLVSLALGFWAGIELVGALGLTEYNDGGYADIAGVLGAFGILCVTSFLALLVGMTVYARMVWRFRVWRDRTRAGRMLVG